MSFKRLASPASSVRALCTKSFGLPAGASRLRAKSLRQLLIIGFVLAMIVITTACSFRKNAPDNSQFNVSAAKLGCMDKAGTQIGNFLKGTATQDDVGQVYDCASQVLDDFVNDTRGAEPSSYSSDEMRRFLTTYFVKQIKLTDDLIYQVGILKQGLVGGLPDRITVDEIRKLQSIFSVLKVQSKKLLPFMPIGTDSTGKWTGFGGHLWVNIQVALLNQFAETLVDTTTAVGAALDGNGLPYRFDQLDDLLNAFMAAMPMTSDFQSSRDFVTSITKNMDLISRGKQTLLSPEVGTLAQRLDPLGAVISQGNMAPLFMQVAAGLDQVLLPAQTYQFGDLASEIHSLLAQLPSGAQFQYPREYLAKTLVPLDTLVKLGTPVKVPERIKLLQLLIPHDVQLSSGNDLSVLFSTLARWGNVVVRLKWYMDPDRLLQSGDKRMQGADLQNFRSIFDHVYGVLADVVVRHDNQLIDYDELARLISVLPADQLPASPDSISASLQPLIQRIIGGIDPGAGGRAAQGLNPDNVEKIHDIFYNWYEGQHFLETLFTRLQQAYGDGPDKDYVRETLLDSPTAAGLWKEVYQQTPEWTSTTVLAAKRTENLLRALRPLFQGDNDEITFPQYSKGLRYSFHDLSELNWMQSLSRLLLRGYAEKDDKSAGAPTRGLVDQIGFSDDPRVGMGISKTEFSQFFNDFMQLGVSIKFFDPDDKNSANNRFREGDTFTYVSDGNGYLDLNETTTLLAFAISTKRKADRIHTDVAEAVTPVQTTTATGTVTTYTITAGSDHHQCLIKLKPDGTPDFDKYGKVQIDYTCYMNAYFNDFQDYWNGMDEMVSYYQGLNDSEQLKYRGLLETVGRKQGYAEGIWINSDDTEGLVAGLQYIEAVFTRYDKDENGYLNPSEAQDAFPVFKRVLQDVAQTTLGTTLDDTKANLVFTYLLANGQIPPHPTWDVFWWAIWKSIPFCGNFKADRTRILQIFAAIAEANGANPPPLLTTK